MSERLTGLIAAVHTPMHADGSLALDGVGRVVDMLARDGAAGVFVCGTTGEASSLTTRERQATAEAYAAAARGRLKLVVHVGHNSLADARELAAHSASIGAVAISAAPPSYFKPEGVETLASCCAEIASGAPRIPFYYYHIPSMTGVRVHLPSLAAVLIARVPSFAGMKFTDEWVWEFQACVELDGGRLDMLFGRDEMLLSGIVVGARGGVGTTYQWAAPLYRRLWAAFDRGDLAAARAEQLHAVRMIDVMRRYRGLVASKAIMKYVGAECGPPRLPLVALSRDEEAALRRELDGIGFFSWAR